MNPRGGGAKQSVYLSPEVLEEIEQEARRLDRSLSWLVQSAWRLAVKRLRQLPSANGDRRAS